MYAILSTKNFDVVRIRPPKQETNSIIYEPSCILWYPYKPMLPK